MRALPRLFPDRAGPINAIAVQPDGKPLQGFFSSPNLYQIVRLNEDGTAIHHSRRRSRRQKHCLLLIDSDGGF